MYAWLASLGARKATADVRTLARLFAEVHVTRLECDPMRVGTIPIHFHVSTSPSSSACYRGIDVSRRQIMLGWELHRRQSAHQPSHIGRLVDARASPTAAASSVFPAPLPLSWAMAVPPPQGSRSTYLPSPSDS
mmetsp:Transcript_13673/g.35178  ORF Transcript_13673/g.35178 Transcript_13673/m.35178 type:complete len:134 (+) Transcript_13673:269-670(+)